MTSLENSFNTIHGEMYLDTNQNDIFFDFKIVVPCFVLVDQG